MATHADPRAQHIKLTYEDYSSTPDDGQRYELLDGELVVMPAPLVRHQRVLRELLITLSSWVKTRDLREVFVAPCAVVLHENTAVEPDIFYVSKARAPIITERLI